MSCVILLLALLTGCGDDEPAPAEIGSGEPTTAPATAPTAPPDVSQLPSAAVTVADQTYLLPPMVLRLRPGESNSELLLTGHDNAEPTGHTLVLSMTTDATDPAQLAEMPWSYQSPSDEWTDTNQGITLRDERYILRPYDVILRFAPSQRTVRVTISGSFLLFDTNANPELPGKPTEVEAEFDAALVVE